MDSSCSDEVCDEEFDLYGRLYQCLIRQKS